MHFETALGASLVRARPVHGGDVATAYAVDLADGRRVFAKTHPRAPAQFFTTEAAGLRWLRDGVAADGPIAVPEVLAVSDDPPNHLVLEWIAPRAAPAGVTAGRARLRDRAGPPARGRRAVLRARGPPHDGQPRLAERAGGDVGRVLRREPAAPAGASRRDSDALAPSTIAGLERVAARLTTFGAADEPPGPIARRSLGREPARSTRPAATGSSTRRPTADTASSTSR